MRLQYLVVVALSFALSTATEPSVEIQDSQEFMEKVAGSSRATLVEFYSAMCGYCSEFKPTWDKLIDQATRLQTARVNIDSSAGMDLAQTLGILDLGVPAVVLFNQQGDNRKYDTLMAGDIYPLSRLLKRIYHRTRGQSLAVDDEGFFLKGFIENHKTIISSRISSNGIRSR